MRGIEIQTKVFANPSAKINEIKKLAKKAGVPEVGEALEETYNGKIRNAFFHSDYAISNDHFVLFSEAVFSKKKGVQPPVIELDELGELTRDAFAFHSALIILWKRQRRLFINFKGKILPYDFHYKGVIEFTFEDDSLNGFRAYWPNGTTCVCMRDTDGNSIAQNVRFRPDGSVDFFVGVLASRPGPFSPCVEQDCDQEYAVVPGLTSGHTGHLISKPTRFNLLSFLPHGKDTGSIVRDFQWFPPRPAGEVGTIGRAITRSPRSG